MRFTFLFLIFFILLTNFCNGQISSDTLEDVDTIVIYKEPIIIRKEVYLSQQKSSQKYIDIFVAPLVNFNYLNVCTSCAEFKKDINNAISQRLNYSFGSNLYFTKRKVLFSMGLAYTIMREHFNTLLSGESISTVNNFQYLDLGGSLGYKLGNNKMTYIVSLGGISSYLLSKNGKTFSETIDSSIVNLSGVSRYRPFTYSVTFGIKFIYKLNEFIKIYTEPFYRGNILSITKSSSIYVQYRRLIGLRFGLFYSF